MTPNVEVTKLTLCIPIYRPPLEFFERLCDLEFSPDLELTLLLCETLEINQIQINKDCIQRLKQNFANVHYITISKEDFGHARTRNEMVAREHFSEYIIFSTQDTFFPKAFSDSLIYSVKRMESQNLAGLCFRHESPSLEMNAVFDNIFKNFPYDSYLDGKTDEINWWSNNFAIYRSSVIREIHFPESVSWAEDMAWAKLVSNMGYRLAVTSSHAVKHLNDDTFRHAYSRGLENGIGLIEINHLFGKRPPVLSFKKDLFRAAIGMVKIEIRASQRRSINKVRLTRLVKAILIWSSQAAGRIILIKRFKDKEATDAVV